MAAPPLLLVDIGNSRLKWAVARAEGPLKLAGEMETAKATAAKIRALAKQYSTHRLVLASVVPRLVPHCQSAFRGRIDLVRAALPALGLRFHYPKPAEIGADRLAAAVAVHADGIWPVIAVSCGTAIAFSVIDANGRFCGGVIAPGLHAQLAALVGATAQLPSIAPGPVRRALGRSTREAIRAGVMLNFQGGVKEILQRLAESLPGPRPPRVVLTGGDARYLDGALETPATLRPLLVFEGLRIIGTRAGRKS